MTTTQMNTTGHAPAARGGGAAQDSLSPTPGGGGPGLPPDLHAFFGTLLDAQCRLVGALAGVVYLLPSAARRGGIVASHWADASGVARDPGAIALLDGPMLKRLERVGAEAAGARVEAGVNGPIGSSGPVERLGVVETVTLGREGLYSAEPTHRVLACPLVAEGRSEGACVLVVAASRRVEAEDALERMSLLGARFEAYLWRQRCLAEAQQKTRLRETLELLDSAQQGEDADTMGGLMCHELQRRFGCTRVSIGLIRRGRVRLAAVSGADTLDRKGAAVETIEAAMEECADQDIEIVCPAPAETESDPGERRVVRAHEELSRRFGPAAMLSLPLRVEGDLVGVVLLERDRADPFPAGAAPLLRLVAEFIGPALWTRRLADRGFWAVTRDRLLDLGHATVGPRHTGAKLLGLVALLALALLAFVPIPGRVAADAELRAVVSRTIPPPFSGYLSGVEVKPGDTVEAGDVLARMDTSDLGLELAELESHVLTLETQRDEATARRELAKARTAEASIRESQARITLVADRMERSEIRAPLTGRVSRGDLEAFVGAHVDPTQPLFEIVQDRNVAVLQVDERDIGRVAIGQEGSLVVKALPGEETDVRVARINPVAEPVQGANVYLVETEIVGEAPWLRPGMTGTVKLREGQTTGLRMIMRPLIDEARLWLWW